MRNTIFATAAVAVIVGGGSATAARLITGKDIRDGSITARDIRQAGISLNRLSKGTQRLLRTTSANSFSGNSQSAGPKGDKGDTGPAGPQGPKGDKGDPGASGDTASTGNWGIIDRNTIGSPDQELRSGPGAPPHGTGSLNLAVQGNGNGSSSDPDFTPQEKSSFGNETDFNGQALSSITQVGFWVFETGEDASRGNPNMPNIAIEVFRQGGTSGFSTLVFSPANSASNRWSDYIDGTTTAPNNAGPIGWYYTGSGNTCNINNPCNFADAKAEYPDATIISIAVTKGRDFSWQGAIDALRINSRLFDFEEKGVKQSGGT